MPVEATKPPSAEDFSAEELRLMGAVFRRCCDQLRIPMADVTLRTRIAAAIVKTGLAGARTVQPLFSAGLSAARRDRPAA
ncbi:MAG: hypothetical protein J0H01_37195 [Rhizobiales bacterium]|nr:hypothetical protein [Hyphomicrobiales bacterium]